MTANPIHPYWQVLGKAMLPELVVEQGEGSALAFFSALLAAAKAAHRANDDAFLLRAYAFAHWGMSQPDRDVWNAAGVGFFQHLFDDMPPDTVAPWIASEAFSDVVPLLEVQLGAERARKVRKRFEARKVAIESNYPGVIARAEREMTRAS